MRKIKFKIWDPGNKTMLPHDQKLLLLDTSGNIYMTSSRQGDCELDLNLCKEGIFIPLEYTGLKDKNDKEIYEGDIINFHRYMFSDGFNKPIEITRKDFVSAVEFDEEEAKYTFKNQFCHEYIDEEGEPDKSLWGSVRVIGNIYENPELIEKSR
jgi:uncharacterized phage protein (TIGR01671 family)